MGCRDTAGASGTPVPIAGSVETLANGASAAPLALALPPIFLLVGPNLGIRYASGPAEQYLERAFPLSVTRGRLAVHDPGLKTQLLPSLRWACASGKLHNTASALHPLIDWRDPVSGALHVFRVTTMIVPDSEPGRSESLAGAFIDAPSVRFDPVDLYAAKHKLSRTEHRLLALLVAGHDLNSAARELGQKISTTRTVLKKVFFKTDTHRQAELIRNVLQEHSA